MTQLQNTLDRMLFWIDTYLSEYAQSFQPGLSLNEIESAFAGIEYRLPDDFYELYQWRNGNSEDPSDPVLYFSPLEEVIEFRSWLITEDSDNDLTWKPEYKGCPLLPIIKTLGWDYAIVLGLNYSTEPHLALLEEGGEVVIAYDSIRSLVESITACYDCRAYHYDENLVFWEDEQQAASIFRERNPRVIAQAKDSLERELVACTTANSATLFTDHVDSLFRALQILKPFHDPEAIQTVQAVFSQLQSESANDRHLRRIFRKWLSEMGVQ